MRVLMTPLEWMLVGLLNKQRAMMSVTAMVRTVNKAKAWAKGNNSSDTKSDPMKCPTISGTESEEEKKW